MAHAMPSFSTVLVSPPPTEAGAPLQRLHFPRAQAAAAGLLCAKQQRLSGGRTWSGRCGGRRRVRYEEEEYGHNVEMEMLESYSESARSEALLVRTTVDGEEEEVLIFRGFSSCLSGRTAADPSKSVLPARAVIQSIDVVRGPFDPSNIEYLEQGLTWETFKARLESLTL